MNDNWTKEENIDFLVKQGYDRREAEFIVAIESGETFGDVVVMENDRVVKPDWAKKSEEN